MKRLDLTSDERQQLCQILGCDDSKLDARIEPFSIAATEEYIRMVLGQRVFTRGQDVREYRLYLLIKHEFDGRLPDEQEISALFQTTITQSRALLRAVMSKYQYELQNAIAFTLVEAVQSATRNEELDRWHLVVDSESIIDALNRSLARIDGTLRPITRVRNSVTTYEVSNSSYEALNSETHH